MKNKWFYGCIHNKLYTYMELEVENTIITIRVPKGKLNWFIDITMGRIKDVDRIGYNKLQYETNIVASKDTYEQVQNKAIEILESIIWEFNKLIAEVK